MEKKSVIIRNILHDENEMKLAVGILKNGGLLVFPTETVYGLGADAFNDKAVKSIFTAKGRPQDNPLIVHIPDIKKLDEVAIEIPKTAYFLFEAFSPGPLTVVLPKNNSIPSSVTAGLNTVAVRIPSHPVARLLLEKSGLPIAAPSANRSGRPSPTTLAMAVNEMMGRVDAIIDGNNCEVGLESTVVRVVDKSVEILRPGAITEEMIFSVLDGKVSFDIKNKHSDILKSAPASPGMKYNHYKPKAEVYILSGMNISTIANKFPGKKIGFILIKNTSMEIEGVRIVRFNNLEEYAREFYRTLNYFDEQTTDVIVAESVEYKGIGHAIMDRLLKASGGKYLK